MDRFIDTVELVRDTVADKNLKIPYVCCYASEFLNGVIKEVDKTCPQKSVDFVTTLIEGAFSEAMDLSCGQFIRNSDACASLLQSKPIRIAARKTTRGKSCLMPMVDILTSL